jgi:thiol-disulfide isomerase/thioredoxin
MKKHSCLFLLLLIFTSIHVVAQENSFIIKGVLKNLGTRKVYLGNKPNGYTMGFTIKYYDSCISSNDSFMFKGIINETDYYSIEIAGSADWCSFLLEKKCTVYITGDTGDVYHSKIVGCTQDSLENKFNREYMRPLYKMIDSLESKIALLKKQKDTMRVGVLKDSLNRYYKLLRPTRVSFIKNHPDAYISLAEISYMPPEFFTYDTLRYYYSLLSPALQQHSLGRKLYYELYQLPELTKLGATPPDIQQADSNGIVHKLSHYRGKYVILDFWASWCGPCRADLPGLKKLYRKYHASGLEVIGIALDHNRAKWTEALRTEKMPWPNWCDMNGSNNAIALRFGIKSIPKKFLLGPDGKILATGGWTKDLEPVLAQRLKLKAANRRKKQEGK